MASKKKEAVKKAAEKRVKVKRDIAKPTVAVSAPERYVTCPCCTKLVNVKELKVCLNCSMQGCRRCLPNRCPTCGHSNWG